MADRKDDRSGFGGWMDVSSPNRKCTGWFRKSDAKRGQVLRLGV